MPTMPRDTRPGVDRQEAGGNLVYVLHIPASSPVRFDRVTNFQDGGSVIELKVESDEDFQTFLKIIKSAAYWKSGLGAVEGKTT